MKLSAGSKLCSAALLILLQACSGGNTSSGVAAGPPTPHADGTSAQATATFEIEIPLPTSASPLSSSARRPSYVSAATQSVKISVLTVNGTPPSGLAPTVANVTPTSNGCTVDAAQPGDYTCTIAAIVPAGSDSLEVSLFSSPGAAGSLLAQQITPVTINPGVANNVSAVLDADPGAITVTATANTGISGTQAAGFVTAGTIAQTLTIHVADKAGDLIGPALPGAPTLTAGSSVPTVASVSANTAAGTLSITPGTAFGSTTITVTANPATTTSGLTASATTFTVNNEPLIAAGGCAPSCSASLLAYGSGVFTTYGTLPAASFGSKEISAFGFDGNDTLYVADEPGDSTEGFLEFGNAEFDVPTPPTAPAPALTLTDANDLDGVTGFDVTREGTLSIANAGLNGSAPTNQFEAYAPGASAPELGMNFGSNAFGEAVAAMPSATGTIQGYAVALFNELSNTGSVGVVIPGGSGATCDSATSASVPCGLIPLGSADDVFADGSFDLVWDRADQALIVADYDATTNDYSLVQLDWNGSSFGAPIVLPVPSTADAGAYDSDGGPFLTVSADGHVAAVFTTTGANYDVRIYAPGTTLAARTSVDITSIVQPNPSGPEIADVELLPSDLPLILTTAASSNLCVYNLTPTPSVAACTTVANAIDAGVSASAVHRVFMGRPLRAARQTLWTLRHR